MKNAILILSILLLSSTIYSQKIDKLLKEKGIQLPVSAPPLANYLKAVRVGKLIYLSGTGPMQESGKFITGKLGESLTLEQGQEAARLSGLNLLSALKAEIKNLDNVKRIVKVLGMVNCTPDFIQQPQVINGFSDLMVEVFGEKGKHARSAVGVGSLPANIPVEIEMIVEIK